MAERSHLGKNPTDEDQCRQSLVYSSFTCMWRQISTWIAEQRGSAEYIISQSEIKQTTSDDYTADWRFE